ncbi:MAG TPA: hypothetical protein VJQ56_14635 [Blastocatellia bacterium]|nr:hypothetical protein [Blastocatellia bacterium]
MNRYLSLLFAAILLINAKPPVLAEQGPAKTESPAKTQSPAKTESPAKADTLPDPYMVMYAGVKENNYLTPLVELKRNEGRYAKSGTEEQQMIFRYMMSYLHSYVGNYQEAHAYYDDIVGEETRSDKQIKSSPKTEKDIESSPLDAYQARSAIETIAALADTHNVIMINEEHDEPMHRAFTTRLLPLLYAKGFRYLAAETLMATDKDLNQRGYPTQKTGFYTADPVYGDMIRTAMKLGYKAVAYEHASGGRCTPQADNPSSCQDERERGQAQNLYDRIFRDDPKAKVIVHVGRGHNQEIKREKLSMMAAHFKVITGIDPFTIDQMFMSERSSPAAERAVYRYITAKREIKEPVAFQSEKGEFWKGYGFDLQLFHPRTRYERGRPVWLRMGGMRKAKEIEMVKLKGAKQALSTPSPVILVQAFFAREGTDALPVDQVVVTNAKDAPVLVLPRGAYRIRAIDKAGKIVGQYETLVN